MYKEANFWTEPAGAGAKARPEAGAATPVDRAGQWQRLLREPLTHFVLLGLAIFAAAHWLEARSQRYRITVSPEDLTRIENSYIQQYGVAPDPGQMHTMVDNYLREEIYLREGLALGLDKNDEIVRRRVAQKYQFLQADMAVPRAPSEAELRSWFATHRSQFAEPARRSFDQRYYAIDQRGDAAARTLAGRAATRLAQGQVAPAADEFPGPKVVARLAQDDVDRLFGSVEFAAAVFAAKPGAWVGPIRSGFGWHVVRVTEATPARPRDFAEVRNDALAAWQQLDRNRRNGEAYRQLLARYTIHRADVR